MQLGRYQILKQLATGDVADVLLARASGLEGFARHVVIKCIRPELAAEQRLVESFLEEARIAASLHHQNIVQVHDIGEQDGRYFFAMEYVHGEEVRQLIAKVREIGDHVPLGHLVAIMTATSAGLHHAHEQRSPMGEPLGLVHRDVCPANILLGYDGSVKLVDFGMARAALRSTKTASGSLKGKASYMSPEQCMGKTVDRRSDIFALGIVLYELATAERLYKAANEYLTMAAIVDGSVPPPSTFRPDLPPAFDEIVLRALAREPEARYQTAEDLRAALERFARDQELRTSNKALADYVTALFGSRLEPWHEEAELRAASTNLDSTSGRGLVAAPEIRADLITKHAPRSTSPIMLAQSIAERNVDDDWSEPPSREATRNERPMPAAKARPITGDDDPYGATVIAPPVFVEEESTIGQAEREAVAAAVLGNEAASAQRAPTATDDEDLPPTLTGTEDVPAPATLTGTEGAEPSLATTPFDKPPERRPSEMLYVGPPAPSQLVQKFFATYQRSIVVGGAAGILAIVIVVLAARSCGG